MSKIYSHIRGGLGNQLFIYAATYSLSKLFNISLYLDTHSYFKTDKFKRKYQLNKFNIQYNEWKGPRILLGCKILERLPLLKGEFALKNRRIIVYKKKAYTFEKKFFSNNFERNYVYGYFQNEKYFINYRSNILKNLTTIEKLDSKTESLISLAKSANSVSLHIRLNHGVVDNKPNPRIKSLDEKYYQKALNYIISKVKLKEAFIFSDSKTRLNIKIPKNIKVNYVDHNNDEDSAYRDIEIMKNCKHNIIANSSFSWWGGWLNENKSKIVISPNHLTTHACPMPSEKWIIL